jgi:uncharacterized protein (TIGR02147 family)
MNGSNIYLYDDPVAFLADRLKQRKISHRVFAEQLGLKSSATLNHILNGRRKIVITRELKDHEGNPLLDDSSQPIIEDLIPKYAFMLGLQNSEAEFFRLLVQYTAAKETAERERIYLEMKRSRVKSNAFKVGLKGHEYFSRWYYAPILELLHYKTFTLEDSSAIGRCLYPHLSALDVRKAIDKLIELELIEVDKDGVLKRIARPISAEGLPLSHLRHRNRELLDIAKAAQDDFARHQRNLSSATMAMSEANWKRVNEKINELREWILGLSDDPKDIDRVVQINFAAHPLTQLEVDHEA